MDLYAKQLSAEKAQQRKREELERKQFEAAKQQRIKELNEIINNEDSTVRQVKEAKKELEQIAINKWPIKEMQVFEDRS